MQETKPQAKPFIHVAAGMILRTDGSLLLGQRPADKPWPGWWELPGGKLEPGETPLQALARELEEELGIQVTHATPWITYTHEYPKNIVCLEFCKVTGWNGEPHGRENQALAWVNPNAAPAVGPLLPATEPPLRWLRVPDRYLLSSIGSPDGLPVFISRLQEALKNGLKLVQFREPGWPQGPDDTGLHEALRLIVALCHTHGAKCLVNSAHPQSWWQEADGAHLRAADALAALKTERVSHYAQARPHPALGLEPDQMLAVSAHNAQDLQAARTLNANFVVIGHVLPTPSHPNVAPLGWEAFASLAHQAGLPVLAIGGQSNDTLLAAQQHGAHGIAGIRMAAKADAQDSLPSSTAGSPSSPSQLPPKAATS